MLATLWYLMFFGGLALLGVLVVRSIMDLLHTHFSHSVDHMTH
ncbi:hypothetical protein [Magnetococcus sp. PR-3]